MTILLARRLMLIDLSKYKKCNWTMSESGPIIFVEDDADDQFIYEEVCVKLGMTNRVRFFNRGETVLKYLRETTEKPLIIFCDINMPIMDGLQLRKQINNDERLRQKSIPFVFFSTAATPSQVKTAYDLTVQGFFLKGHNFGETMSTIKMVLDYWQRCYHPNAM
jgi:CheY-like chemotaxis protein